VGEKYRLFSCRYRVVDLHGKITISKTANSYCTN
jgi:hypothetical protein